MKIIKYIPKNTAAGTEYREIHEDDKVLALVTELDTQNTDDSIWIRDHWWHKRNKKLHKGQNGLNSPASVIGGIVHNMMYKTPLQRDFSSKQMEDLEMIMNGLHAVYPEITPYRFQISFGE
jgi:N-acetyl-anhydromuramyl-L-alanine amidase AmpD